MFNQKKLIIPELDKVELDEYISLKQSQTIIFNDYILKDLETPEFRKYVESEEFMAALTEFVALNYITKIADYNIKNNIFNVINYIRNNKRFATATEKSELIDNLNEIVITLNSSSDANNIDFYRNQYYRRTAQQKTRFSDFAYDQTFMEERKKSLNISISFDFLPISDLTKINDEQTFIQEVVPDNLITHNFLNTLNILFVEMPSLYSDERFVKRAKFILENNILLLKDKESIYELEEDDEIDADLMPRTQKILRKIKRISR